MSPLILDPAYGELKRFIIENTGLAYYAGKDAELGERVGRRLAATAIGGCGEYLRLLRHPARGEGEMQALVEELAIGETYFFRHLEQFDALRRLVLPNLIAKNHAVRRLRIWSAGCANGAELYSISILLEREFRLELDGWAVSLVGTDINHAAMAAGREGCFEDWSLRSTPEEIKSGCFVRAGRNWTLVPEYRRSVSFHYHNLVKHPFPSLMHELYEFDLILCRNVTIYFDPESTRRTVSQLHQCLVEGGWLLVGPSEPNFEIFQDFQLVDFPGATLYRKSLQEGEPVKQPFDGWAAPAVAWQPPPVPAESKIPAPAIPQMTSPNGLAEVRSLADRGQWELASACCQELLERDLLNPMVHFYHALLAGQAGKPREKERSLRRAIYLDRSCVLAHYHLGLFLQDGRPAEAVRCFENVARLLRSMDDKQSFEHGDGITVAELKELTRMHLEGLRK